MKPSKNVKIQTYCPKKDANKVRLAIGKAGAGIIGNYTYCSFLTSGNEYFLPMKGSNPAIGKQGKHEKVEGYKIEFICKKNKAKTIVDAIKKAHPYEEVVIEVFPLLDF